MESEDGGGMSLPKERKQEIIESFRRDDLDTGSPEIQVALLTERIAQLTEHLKVHKKDHTSRRGLLMMVNQRASLLKYLARVDRHGYLSVISRLGLRK
jgi:small subunit ribosomal protein S15